MHGLPTETGLVKDENRRERLLSLVDSEVFHKRVSEIPAEYFLKSESEIAEIAKPTSMEFAIKKSVWSKFMDLEKSGQGRKLRPVDFYGDFATRQFFFDHLLRKPAKLMWLLCPPVEASLLIEEAFFFGLKRIRDEILTMPITEKTAPVILKAVQYFTDRHLGPMVQRIESKNLNVSANVEEHSVEEIKEKLKQLRLSMGQGPVGSLLVSRDVTSDKNE